MKDLIDSVIAQEFNAPDLEFAFSAEASVDPQQQEAILSNYTSKGILTINEARAALGRDPLAEPAANKPMALTGAGYVPLGQAEQAAGKTNEGIEKFNPYHDERGRFATAEGAGIPTSNTTNDRKLAFSGVLIDKRYDEVANITHCTYSTPVGTFTIEAKGHLACPDTYPVPRL